METGSASEHQSQSERGTTPQKFTSGQRIFVVDSHGYRSNPNPDYVPDALLLRFENEKDAVASLLLRSMSP